MAAAALGRNTAWLGFLGGAIGQECGAALRQLGIHVSSVRTKSPTRCNLEMIEDSGRVTELLEPGAAASNEEQGNMIQLCQEAFAQQWKSVLLVISGSLPPGMPPGFYASIIAAAHAAGLKVFLDTSGEWLLASLEARPDFVKINRKESEAILKTTPDHSGAIAAATELLRRGAHSAAITLGEEGLVWLPSADTPAWIARPPKLQAISAVGCGDATLAGFAHAALSKMEGEKAIRFAAACGAANCLAKVTARISSNDVQSLLPQIEVQRLA